MKGLGKGFWGEPERHRAAGRKGGRAVWQRIREGTVVFHKTPLTTMDESLRSRRCLSTKDNGGTENEH